MSYHHGVLPKHLAGSGHDWRHGGVDEEQTRDTQAVSSVRCPSCGGPAGSGSFCGVCGMRLAPARPVVLTAPSAAAPTRAAKGYAPLAPNTILDHRYRV